MKFKVHTDFPGAQDGIEVTNFKAGEVVEISDYLAPHIGAWADPVEEEHPVSTEHESPKAGSKRSAAKR